MPRTRKRLKSLVRQMPKTTGVLATGSCGHETKERIRVNVWGDYTEENFLKLKKEKEKFLEESFLTLCRNCIADEEVSSKNILLKKLTDLLEINDFPELQGSQRMNAFAQGVRFNMARGECLNISNSVKDRLNSNSFVDQILLSTLKKAWPGEEMNIIPADIISLSQEVNNLASEPEYGLRKYEERYDLSLATWLLLKYRFPNNFMLISENRSKVWIAISRARYGSPLLSIGGIPSQVYLSAIIVSQFNCWNDRNSAWNAFHTLNSLASKDIVNFLEQRSKEATSFKLLIKEAGVVSALLGENQEKVSSW